MCNLCNLGNIIVGVFIKIVLITDISESTIKSQDLLNLGDTSRSLASTAALLALQRIKGASMYVLKQFPATNHNYNVPVR